MMTMMMMRFIAAAFILVGFQIIGFIESSNINDVKVSYDPLAEPWLHLSEWDNKSPYNNFICENYEPLCTNFLDQIDCSSSNRTITGCIDNQIAKFAGQCICNGDPVYFDMSGRVGEQLIDNRIKGSIKWMLEPWATGPPYSVAVSYPPICELFLTRIDCPTELRNIGVVTDYSAGTTTWTCTCGNNFTASSTRIQELICDQLNNAPLSELVVLSDPFTFSVEFSIAVVLFVGKIGAILASAMYLPPIIGFLLSGVLIQDIISSSLISGAGGDGPHATPFGEIRVFALIVVLMRAGLTTKPSELISRGYLTTALSIVPYFAEFAVMMGYTKQAFGWVDRDAGLMCSILAALSPSLVIPGMIKLVGENLGYTPACVLSSAPIEVVLSIILYGIFASLEQTTTSPLYPWVTILPLYGNALLIPVNILFSIIIGVVGGYIVLKYIQFREACKDEFINRVVPKGVGEYLFATIVTCYTMYAVCVNYYIPQTSGVLAVFSMTLTLSQFSDEKIVEELKSGLAGLWIFLEVFLFTTTGINLSFKAQTGPAQSDRGITNEQVGNLIGVLFTGTLGRAAGIALVGLVGMGTLKPHRRHWKYMLAWIVSTWMFQWPKATVQATLGVLPFQNHVIPGSIGLTRGLFILRASAFAILVMAPIGVFLTATIGKPLAIYLHKLDREAEGSDQSEKAEEIESSYGNSSKPMIDHSSSKSGEVNLEYDEVYISEEADKEVA